MIPRDGHEKTDNLCAELIEHLTTFDDTFYVYLVFTTMCNGCLSKRPTPADVSSYESGPGHRPQTKSVDILQSTTPALTGSTSHALKAQRKGSVCAAVENATIFRVSIPASARRRFVAVSPELCCR
jgi:hypothetical protein